MEELHEILPSTEEDFSSFSITERLSHKNWKARVNAYEELINAFQASSSNEDPIFSLYISNTELLQCIIKDANVFAQERGLECLTALVKFAGEKAAHTHEVVVPLLVDKCLGSARAATQNQALELILQYLEVVDEAAMIIAEVLPGLSAKQPKVVSGCTLALKEIIRAFGTQVTSLSPILKTLPIIFSHTDQAVRSEGTELTYVLYQGIGAEIEQWLVDLKSIQIKELKDAFEEMEKEGRGKGTLKPTRITKRQVTAEKVDSAYIREQADPQDGPSFAPHAASKDIDITSKLSTSFYADLKSSNWQERMEALDNLSTLMSSTSRIQDTPRIAELINTLATTVTNDTNVNCVMVAASCIAALANGTGSTRFNYHETTVPLLLERLKERKANVTDSIGAALDAVFLTTSLPDIIPDLDDALKSKNPQIKEGTLKFLGRCLSTAATPIHARQIQPLTDQLVILLEDSHEGTRNEAAICFGTLIKMVGKGPLSVVMASLADVRKAKVNQAYDEAAVRCKTGEEAALQPECPVPTAAPIAKGEVAMGTDNNPVLLEDPMPVSSPVFVAEEATLPSTLVQVAEELIPASSSDSVADEALIASSLIPELEQAALSPISVVGEPVPAPILAPMVEEIPPTSSLIPVIEVSAPDSDSTPVIDGPALNSEKQAIVKPPVKKPASISASAAPAAKKMSLPTVVPPKSVKSSGGPLSALDGFKFKYTSENADTLIGDLIPASFTIGFVDANWKTRLNALEELGTWMESQFESLDAELIFRALAKKGWSEKNFQVSAKLYGILNTLSQQCPSFGRSCVALSVPHLTEKLGDVKLKKPAGDTLLSFAEKTSLQFVLNQAYEPLSKQKSPKVLSDALIWINTALLEFGIAGISLRALIDFLKTSLQNSNAAVRTSATKTLVSVKLFSGSGVKDLLEDLNPQLLNTISSEFEKVEGEPTPEPSRTSLDVLKMATSSSMSGDTSVTANPLDDLFPRVEIDSLLKGTSILKDLKNDAWKVKKDALETLKGILDQGSNKRLKPAMGEIGQILKTRVVDANKAVQTLALDIVAQIAEGMGNSFEKHSRLFVLPVSTVLADQKAPIRNAALQTLTAIVSACGIEPMMNGLSSALETSNPMQKGTLLHWLTEWFKEHSPPNSVDMNGWVAPVLSSLDDRNSDVRKGAQAMLPIVIRCVGYDQVMQRTNSLKPASRNSAVQLIQAARPAGMLETTVSAPKITPKAIPKPITAVPSAKPVVKEPAGTNGNVPPSKPTGIKIGSVRRKLPLAAIQVESQPASDAVGRRSSIVPPKKIARVSSAGQKTGIATASLSRASEKTQTKERSRIPDFYQTKTVSATTSQIARGTQPTNHALSSIPRPNGSALPVRSLKPPSLSIPPAISVPESSAQASKVPTGSSQSSLPSPSRLKPKTMLPSRLALPQIRKTSS